MNLLYSLRMLRKNPGFTAAAVFTLALATGSNIAIFSIVNSILLRPLPFRDPGRLVRVRDIPPGGGQFAIAPANFLDWSASSQTLDLAAIKSAALNLTGSGEPMRVRATRVTANSLSLLGVAPLLGRTFLPEEDDPSHSRTVVISSGLWKDRFGAQSVLGHTLTLNGAPYTVIGIMPAGFRYPQHSDLWIPMAWTPADRATRGAHYLQALGRIRPGASLEQARLEMSAIGDRLARQFPDDNKDWGVRITPLIDDTVGSVRTALWVLTGATGLVLLIGCVNVANLLLVRSAARRKEMAVRVALGADQLHLLRQLFTEGMLLALLGTTVGLALAPWTLRLIVAIAPAGIPRLSEASLDSRSLFVGIAIALLTALVFAFTPAAQLGRIDLNDCMKAGGRTGQTDRRGRARGLFVIAETALAVLLLIGAGLLMKSFLRLQDVPVGFDPKNVLTMSVALRGADQTPLQWSGFFQSSLARIAALPGVQKASVVGSPPFLGDNIYTVFKEGHTERGEGFGCNFYNMSAGYFETMRIPLLKGRAFTDRDTASSQRVAIVNERAALRMFPNEDPIGKRINITNQRGTVWRDVVGVVGDTKQYGRDAANTRQVYEPYLQKPSDTMTLLVRTSGDPLKLANAVREQARAIDRDQPVAEIQTMEEIVSRSIGDRRFSTLLLGVFAGLALLLAAIGTYGVMAYAVAQRTHEIGVRMAVGARSRHILRLVVGEGATLAITGVALGAVAAVVLSRVLKTQLYEVSPTDPVAFSGVILLLLGVALLATLIPALRATTVDPIRALRQE